MAELRAAGVGIDRVLMLHDGTPDSSDLFQELLTLLDAQVFDTGLKAGAGFWANVKGVLEQEYTLWAAFIGSTFVTLATHGTARMSDLARALLLDRTALSRTLDPLVERGLVSITPGRDARTREVSLTRAGAPDPTRSRPSVAGACLTRTALMLPSPMDAPDRRTVGCPWPLI